MTGSDASEGQAVWQPGGAEEDSRLREGNRHLHLAYNEEEEEELDPEDSTRRKRESNPESSALEVDALTTRPTKRC